MFIRKFELMTKDEIMTEFYKLIMMINEVDITQNIDWYIDHITDWFVEMNSLVEGGEHDDEN